MFGERISISDYKDWAYIENFQHPRSHKGYLTRENVVSFYGTLGVDGVKQSAGVTVCIENLDDPRGRPLIGKGYQCRDICAAVDCSGLRLIYDCGASLFVDADSLETLRDMLPYVVTFMSRTADFWVVNIILSTSSIPTADADIQRVSWMAVQSMSRL